MVFLGMFAWVFVALNSLASRRHQREGIRNSESFSIDSQLLHEMAQALLTSESLSR